MLLLVGLLAGSKGVAEGRQADPDYLKASFAYRLVHFVTWPESTEQRDSGEAMNFCVMARATMAEALVKVLANRNINGRSIHVQPLSDGDSMRPCEVLFVGSDQVERFERDQDSIACPTRKNTRKYMKTTKKANTIRNA